MKNAPVIIIKKKKGHGHGHHGGAWKVAYADFVTAMMAFFLVMWIVGQSKAVKAGVAGYFRNPGVLENERSNGILPGGDEGVSENAPPKLDADTGDGASGNADERAMLQKKAEALRALLARTPEFKDLQKQIEIQLTKEGLRIELIESSEALFFDTGSASLKADTVRLLGVIAKELGALKNNVIIEGHSDSRRYSTSGVYTNWELSADRANAARRAMEENGLYPHQVSEVRGYADTHLRVPDNPLDAQNRRVSIIVANTRNPAGNPSGRAAPPAGEHGAPAAGAQGAAPAAERGARSTPAKASPARHEAAEKHEAAEPTPATRPGTHGAPAHE
jgi:chemotaxis protein MotB